jgi:hypothetical protein
MSTFPSFQWEIAETMSTAASAVWTDALAMAGATPKVTKTDVEVTPKPIPRHASTNPQNRPAIMNATIVLKSFPRPKNLLGDKNQLVVLEQYPHESVTVF